MGLGVGLLLLLGLKRLSGGLVGGCVDGCWGAAEGFLLCRGRCRGAGNWRSVPARRRLLWLVRLLVEQLLRGGLCLLHMGLLQAKQCKLGECP